MPVAGASSVPFDFRATEKDANWRDRLAWPIAIPELRPLVDDQARTLLRCISETDAGDIRDALLLAAPRIFNRARMLLALAVYAENESAGGPCLIGAPAELDFLRHATTSIPSTAIFEPRTQKLRGVMARRVARMHSWMPAWRLPLALAAPEATAVTHNTLLVDCARAGHQRLGFVHANLVLDALRVRGGGRGMGIDMTAVARDLSLQLARVSRLSVVMQERMASLLQNESIQYLHDAVADLAALTAWRGAPRNLWAGTGGFYAARALALAVQRRGGDVTFFSHGGGAGLCDSAETIAISELAVSDRFVVNTPGIAQNLEAMGVRDMVAGISKAAIVSHDGCSSFRGLGGRVRPQAGRPKLLYALTHLRGARVGHPPFLPDPVYVDWQRRLVERLRDLPIDLVCQRHPEEDLHGLPHPLTGVAEFGTGRFEELMSSADVFLFDWPQSTTFWKALCTNKPIVFIDLGLSGFAPRVDELIGRRCGVLKARYDQRNLPYVDWKELEDVLLGAHAVADGGSFRQLLAGED